MSHVSPRLADARGIGKAVVYSIGDAIFGASSVKLYTRTPQCPRCGERTSNRRTPPLLRVFKVFLKECDLRHCAACRWSGLAPRSITEQFAADDLTLLGEAAWEGEDFSFAFTPEEEEEWVRNIRRSR
jgi:hypothetical protein